MSTTILVYVLVAVLALGGMSTISMIDKPREPITRGSAILSVVLDVVFIFWLLSIIN